MKDRRQVDQVSVEELERLLLIRRREERLATARQADLNAEDRPRREARGVYPAHTLDGRARAARARRRAASAKGGAAESPPEARYPFGQSGIAPSKAAHEAESAPRGSRGRFRDKALLVVEVVLAVALLGVLVASLRTLGEVNRASREAQLLLTPSPTPLIQVALLPGGHSPPDAPGGSAPDEVPSHLRDRVGAIGPVAMPTPGPEHATRVVIASIDVDAPVVEGDDWEALKQGAGHHLGTANPGEQGNCVISAHNDIFGEIFRRLSEVDLGDEVIIHTARQAYRYIVTQKRIIGPEDVSVMFPTSSPVLTLISCHPYGVDTHRIAVTAELQP